MLLFSDQFENIEECKQHIMKNMLFMIEIYPPHISYLKDLFTKNYRSPYAITDTFLNFINSDPKKKN